MATFQIDTSFLDNIKSLIEQGNNALLIKKLKPIHYADIAEIIETLSIEEATYIIKLLKSKTTADALTEVDPDTREQILDNLSINEIARVCIIAPTIVITNETVISVKIIRRRKSCCATFAS